MTHSALDWSAIDTVLLDMDGTLLDLHFDNYFWQQRIPERYAQQHGLDSAAAALEKLMPDFIALQGQLEWYCLDYWSDALSLDVPAIKAELAAEMPSRVKIRPHTVEFLTVLQATDKSVWLTTNAHPRAVEIKFAQLTACEAVPVNMASFFSAVITSHQLGAPKEQQPFWHGLRKQFPFDPERALFADDSLSVLAAAHEFGIAECIAITQPDSQQPRELTKADLLPYRAITYFDEILPITG